MSNIPESDTVCNVPDDVWRKILQIGLKRSELTFKELCSLAVTCKCFNQLASEDSLWCHLLFYDFPKERSWPCNPLWYSPCDDYNLCNYHQIQSQGPDLFSSASPKAWYHARFERNKCRKWIQARSPFQEESTQREPVELEPGEINDMILDLLD